MPSLASPRTQDLTPYSFLHFNVWLIMELEDRYEILDLISSYSHSWDSNDLEKFLSLFVDEPYIGEAGDQFKGKPSEYRKKDKQIMRNEFERMHDPSGEYSAQSRHLQTNTVLIELTDGRVRGRTIYTVLAQHTGEPNPRLFSCGIYEDEYVKIKDGWKFSSRKIMADHD